MYQFSEFFLSFVEAGVWGQKTLRCFLVIRGVGGGGRGKGALDFGDGHWGVMKVFSCHIDPNVITAILSGTSLKYHQKAFSYQAE